MGSSSPNRGEHHKCLKPPGMDIYRRCRENIYPICVLFMRTRMKNYPQASGFIRNYLRSIRGEVTGTQKLQSEVTNLTNVAVLIPKVMFPFLLDPTENGHDPSDTSISNALRLGQEVAWRRTPVGGDFSGRSGGAPRK